MIRTLYLYRRIILRLYVEFVGFSCVSNGRTEQLFLNNSKMSLCLSFPMNLSSEPSIFFSIIFKHCVDRLINVCRSKWLPPSILIEFACNIRLFFYTDLIYADSLYLSTFFVLATHKRLMFQTAFSTKLFNHWVTTAELYRVHSDVQTVTFFFFLQDNLCSSLFLMNPSLP